MNAVLCRKWICCAVLLALLAGGTALANPCDACAATTMDDLRRLDVAQLEELFRRTEMGQPLVGVAKGRLLCVTDKKLPRIKVGLSNAAWRGKAACEDGAFVNRWIGGVEWLGSRYVVGPSWVDGRPAMLIEYAPGTPLFGNMHDELREVSPGLYFGPIYERGPCPKLRGYLAVQVNPRCRNK